VPPKERVLAINPGATSTKFAVYLGDVCELEKNIRHSAEELKQFEGRSVLEQHDFRAAAIAAELEKAGYAPGAFAAVAGRGGLLPPVQSGTYLVDETMLEELRQARRGEHASNLGALLAQTFAAKAGVNAYVVDPVSVDEWQESARFSGSTLIPRIALCHALNTKAVAKRFAAEQERPYEWLRLIVVHMGSGNSVSAHAGGRMIDNNTGEEGPMGVDRSGALPVRPLIAACFRGELTRKQIEERCFGGGGMFSYLGTRDLLEVERRIEGGDREAAAVLDAMVYQIAKEAGAMAVVLKGKVDAVLLTGGMAHSKLVAGKLREYLEWLAPVSVYPGEDELQALSEGAFRVLRGEEQPRRLSVSL
jgi:butyrate kinase